MMNAAARQALESLHTDLRAIFGPRLRSLVAYGPIRTKPPRATSVSQIAPDLDHVHTLALVDRVGYHDLRAAAERRQGWTRLGLATPLLLSLNEFARSLDTFPLEYGDIMDRHVVIAGENPFEGLRVRPEDIRRACEVQAKSHLIHLREGFIEADGQPGPVARLIVASAGAFGTLLGNLARIQGERPMTPQQLAASVQEGLEIPGPLIERVVSLTEPDDLPGTAALDLYPQYLEAAERLWRFVDGWGIEPRRG
jgi:hypothetical protein